MTFTPKLFFDKDPCGNWVKSIRDILDRFELGPVRHYLMESTDKTVGTNAVRAYKSCTCMLEMSKHVYYGHYCYVLSENKLNIEYCMQWSGQARSVVFSEQVAF